MVNKLKLHLKAGEVIALSKHLASVLGSVSMDELRKEPTDMLILSAVYELYAKVKEKAENIRLFGGKRSEYLYPVTVTRTQALALACVVIDEPDSDQALASYEANFLQGLLAKIHQTFLV